MYKYIRATKSARIIDTRKNIKTLMILVYSADNNKIIKDIRKCLTVVDENLNR